MSEKKFLIPLKLLLAEDDIINQKLMKIMLDDLNCELYTVNDGLKAVEFFQKYKIDVIFMDGQMPEMDGFDAVRKIREIEKNSGGHVLIIALTAFTSKNDIEKFLDAGIDDYICKPLQDESSLINVLSKYFNVVT